MYIPPSHLLVDISHNIAAYSGQASVDNYKILMNSIKDAISRGREEVIVEIIAYTHKPFLNQEEMAEIRGYLTGIKSRIE